MKESEGKRPNYVEIAMGQMDLSEEDKKLVNDYGHIMFNSLVAFNTNSENDKKELTLDTLKHYAEEKYPGGWTLVEKVLKKTDELENPQS